MTMKRILVIGSPKSGKTAFAKRLKRKTGLPLYQLDKIMFLRLGRLTANNQRYRIKLAQVLEEDEWIIDGHYDYTLEERLERCDTVFFLDIPTKDCPERIVKEFEKYSLGEHIKERFNDYETKYRPRAYELLEEYKEKNIIIFRSFAEIKKYRIKGKRAWFTPFRCKNRTD